VSQYELITLMTQLILMGVRARPSMVEGKDDEEVTYVNFEMGFGSVRIVKGVDRLIYISDTDMEEGHRQHSIEQSKFRFIYGYLLTFPTWRLSLEFIPVYHLLVLYRSQQGYFSFEVQSCTFIFSSISWMNPSLCILGYSWYLRRSRSLIGKRARQCSWIR